MFGSNSKQNDSLRLRKNDLSVLLNDTANGLSRSFIPPKITSTPLHSNLRKDIFATPPKAQIFSPKRYSLSEIATPPRPERYKNTKQTSPGPLLASTKYDVSISTYEDTKSPGLAGRVVQYSEEVEREKHRHSTHQERYGSPGLFPIVHLFKKKPPCLAHIPQSVHLRVQSPDRTKQHSEEYNRKLMEEIVRPVSLRSRTFNEQNNERSTRSVLDALKEISRKRIHSNEEFDIDEDTGKRLRTEILDNGIDSNKRQRDDSSFDKSGSPNKQTAKKICIYDEYAASCSSMDFSTVKRSESTSKRKNTSTSTENSRDSKSVKLVSVETQTPAEEKDSHASTKNTEDQKDSSEEQAKNEVYLKVIDNAPLEEMRKNRLAALIGTLSGKESGVEPYKRKTLLSESTTVEEPVVSPFASKTNPSTDAAKPTRGIEENKPNNSITFPTSQPQATTSNEAKVNAPISFGVIPSVPQPIVKPPEPKTADKPLVSILMSSKNASPIKHDKHVHFSLPETQTNTQTSTSIATPIVSTIVSDSPQFNFGGSRLSSFEMPAAPSPPTNLTTNKTEAVPQISFVSASNATSVPQVASAAPALVTSVPQVTSTAPAPMFQFNTSKPSFDSQSAFLKSAPAVGTTTDTKSSSNVPFGLNAPKPSVNSPPKLGGFKFDLNKPAASVAPSTAPSFAFNNSKQSENTSRPAFGITPSTSAGASFSLGAPITTTTTTTSASPAPSNMFNFGKPQSAPEVSKPSNSFSFNAPNRFGGDVPFGISTTANQTSQPSNSFTLPKTPTFAFGGNNAPTLSAPTSNAVPMTSVSSFGMSGPMFGNPTTKPAFSVAAPATNNTAAPSFGSTTESTSIFNKNPSTFGQNSMEPSFGPPNVFVTPATTAPPAFETPTTNSFNFGAPTSSNNIFGTPKTTASFAVPTTSTFSSPGFGNVVKPSFGANNNNNNGMFGANPQNAQSSFAPPSLGAATNTTSPFGTNTTTTTSMANPFGGSAQATFNFGSKTAGNNGFGTSNSFGPAVTTSNSIFGATNTTTTSFGTPSNNFSNTTSGFGFGNAGTNPPGFGATTTAASSGFGSNATPVIQQSNNNVFGSSATGGAFNSNPAPAFGSSPAPSSGFGTTNNASFGSGFGSAFGKPQASNAFGPSAPAYSSSSNVPSQFGPPNATAATQAGFNFGGATQKAASFSFGSANEAPKPSFNFTGGSANPPVFGGASGGSGSFGGAPPAFGAPQFNAPVAGGFNIGSGTSSRPRTQLKGKRRT